MNFRMTVILALVFSVGLLSVLLLKKQDTRRTEEKKTEGKLLSVEKEKISEIYLEPSGIHAVKDSTQWNIVSPIKTDGEKSSIDAIVNMFDWAKIERSVSSDPNEYASFGLNPERGKMVLIHGASADTFYLGDKSPTGSYVFARKSGSPDVFLATTSLETNTLKSLFDLRDKSVLTFETGKVNSLKLRTPRDEFSLVKEGPNWELAAPIAYKADETKVSQILNRMTSEKVKTFVDEDPKDLAKYGLGKPGYAVDLTLGENRARKTLLIGKLEEGKYFAMDDSKKPVFDVDSSFVRMLNVTLKDLRDKTLADLSATDIDKFVIDRSGGTLSCEKDTANIWQVTSPQNGQAKSWKVSSITSGVANLKVEDFIDDSPKNLKPYGLDKPAARGKFYQKDKLLVDLLIGKETAKDKVYAKTADKNPVVLVKKDILDKLNTQVDDLIEPETQENDKKTITD
jgi:hypothetical protein